MDHLPRSWQERTGERLEGDQCRTGVSSVGSGADSEIVEGHQRSQDHMIASPQQQQQFYTESMLDKYESFIKLSKSPECSVYSAFNRNAAQAVLMKRVKSRLSWNAMLAHRDIQLMNRVKVFPRMTEILKHKGQFFIVFEKSSGNSLAFTNAVEKMGQESFYQLFNDLLEGIKEIASVHPAPTIVPEWIYFHRNSLKVLHFETFLEAEAGEKKHVMTYGIGLENPEFEDNGEDQTDYTPEQFKKNLVFNLGAIAYRFLTGKKEENITEKSQYEAYVANMRESCQRQIVKATGDGKLASFITKMISDNYFQVPVFDAVCNFFESRVRERQRNKMMFKDRSLDIEIQKIHIGADKTFKESNKKVRKCCLKEEKINSLITKEKFADLKKIGLKSNQQLFSSQKNKLFLPYISTNRNYTCVNRHHPFLTNHKHYKEHQKSYDFVSHFQD